MPPWPMAMPSSTAMVSNSAAKQPRASMRRLTYWPISCRWTCPGTNCVKELAMPMIGRPICVSRMPLARQRLLAPAMRRPVVVTELLSGCFILVVRLHSRRCPPKLKKPLSVVEKGFLHVWIRPSSRYRGPMTSRLMTMICECFGVYTSVGNWCWNKSKKF